MDTCCSEDNNLNYQGIHDGLPDFVSSMSLHVAPTPEHGFLKNKSENQKSEMQRHSIEQNSIHSLSQIWCAVSFRAVISIRKIDFSLILSFLSIQISLVRENMDRVDIEKFCSKLILFYG